jgi:origin recognition complex subunit 1
MYLTASVDRNAMESINGPAFFMSAVAFNKKYPTGKVPRRSKEYGKTFICRRGVDPRRAQYTEEFIWEDIPRSTETEMEELFNRIENETGSKQKRPKAVPKRKRDDVEFKAERAVDGEEISTPRKRQKMIKHITPRKPRTNPKSQKVIIFAPSGVN